MSGRTTSTTVATALAAVVALTLAGCGSDSDAKSDSESPKPSASTLDTTDPSAVAKAYAEAMATGDCAAAAKLHSTEPYGINCSDADMYKRWSSYKQLGLTFNDIEPSDDTSSGDCEDFKATACKTVTLVFTSATGYQPKEDTILGEKDGQWLVVNDPPYADLLDPTANVG